MGVKTIMSDFTQKVLKDNPHALIVKHDDGKHHIAVDVKKDNEFKRINIIGCEICLDQKIKMIDGKMIIGESRAIPVTAVVEDDSYNPLLPVLFFCPVCSRILVDPAVKDIPVLGVVSPEWLA